MDKDCDDSGNSDWNDILPYFETPKKPRVKIRVKFVDVVLGMMVFLALVEKPSYAISILLGFLVWEFLR